MQTIPVSIGESVGEFCARNGVSREALFAMNPHLYDQGAFYLNSGELTAQLVEGQPLRVYAEQAVTPDMLGPMSEKGLKLAQDCAKEGGSIDMAHGCGKLQGDKVVYPDGTTQSVTEEEKAIFEPMRACIAAGGFPLEGKCHPIVQADGQLYTDTSKTLSTTSGGTGGTTGGDTTDDEKKEEGWGLGTKVGISVGALLLGAIAIKVLF